MDGGVRRRKRSEDSTVDVMNDMGQYILRSKKIRRTEPFQGQFNLPFVDTSSTSSPMDASSDSGDSSSGYESSSGDSSSYYFHVEELMKQLPSMVKGIKSQDNDEQLIAMSWFRRFVTIDTVQDVIDAGAIPRIVQFLEREDFPKLQHQAAWAIANIVCEGPGKAKVVEESNAVPKLVKLLESNSDKIQAKAAFALSYLAGNTTK